jgi:CheY-like chemotaxis protein
MEITMKSTQLPCLYYPTTVALIDDDEIFLEHLEKNLSQKTSYIKFDTPNEALVTLLEKMKDAPHQRHVISNLIDTDEEVSEYGSYAIRVNLSFIYNKRLDKNRFTIPSVAVVDHDMPTMNGVEFCSKLLNHPIQKIMLTGVADHNIAINAFNKGIIQKFISKDDPDLFTSINNAVEEMQKEFFMKLSELILSTITANTFSYLNNPNYIDFLWAFIKDNQIKEFYLIDSIGSFLLFNTNNESIWLIVKSDECLLSDAQIAKDQNASLELINNLSKKQSLLFLFSEEDHKQPVEGWPAYLYPANPLPTIQGCHYAVIRDKLI